jgi:lysophospholipase L1-like esterase
MTKKQTQWVGLLTGILLFSCTVFRETLFLGSFSGVYLLIFLKSASTLVLGYFFAKIINVSPLKFLLTGICFEGLIRLLMPLAQPINERVGKIYKYPSIRNGIQPVTEYMLNLARNIGSDMGSVQYLETGSRYDEELFYTFKPGTFTFQHIDFKNDYRINSKGARDDEQSLKNPDVVFIGDSFTTGLGVSQDETFANQVEKKLNINTLNIGVPSYGTAREMLLLKRFNLDSCKYIVLQYCNNDDTENEAFVANNFRLNKRDEKDYKSAQIYNELVLHYYPFRYIYSLFAKKILYLVADLKSGKVRANTSPQKAPTEASADFFRILQKIHADYPGKRIIVFELGLFSTEDSFYKKVKKLVDDSNMKNVELLDTSKFINCQDCYYNLDFHITPKGHGILADSLAKRIKI